MVNFDLTHIWATMGLPSRLVAFALALMAVASAGVFFDRLIVLWRSARETRRFTRSAGPLLAAWDTSAVVALAAHHRRSALARLVGPAIRKYEAAAAEGGGGVTAVELARRELARRRELIGADLRHGLGVLASVGSVAPFVGLLGTVIGIITAFQSIAASGSGGLGAVSAGIAEALIVTAFGLAVAIPAVLTFNYLSTRIAALELQLERSAGELADEMENEHGRISGERFAQAA